MKGSGKFILGVAALSGFFVLYVYLNISLFGLSYEINDKAQDLRKKTEQYRYLKYEVDELKAPHRLSTQMQQHALELDLPQEIHIVKVPQMAPLVVATVMEQDAFASSTNGLMSFFGKWINIAQADPTSEG